MHNRIDRQPSAHARRGLLTPAIAVALLVVMSGLALVLDRLWLESARVEMTTCAEAAALSAGQRLATDDSLRENFDGHLDLEAARQAAADIAAQNLVAGKPVFLGGPFTEKSSAENPSAGDVRFGQRVLDRDRNVTRFIETDHQPTCVVVTVRRTRAGNNPIALFFGGLTGQQGGDVAVRTEVTIDNRIRGVRPFRGAPVPAMPLAILHRDPTGNRADTWETAIEQRGGGDRCGYDFETGQITDEPDGIPELTLRFVTEKNSGLKPNVRFIDLGTGFQSNPMIAQIRHGWTTQNLDAFGGELTFDGPPIVLSSRRRLSEDICAGLDSLIGQSRICLLYAAEGSVGTDGTGQVRCEELVAVRVMDVRWTSNNTCELLVQPCVLTTRTAMLSTDLHNQTAPASATATGATDETGRNRYIYKLYLSR